MYVMHKKLTITPLKISIMSSETFSIFKLKLGPMDNFIYLIKDHASQRAAVVDPAWDVDKIIALAALHDVVITDVLLTHSHHDHINGLEQLLAHSDAQLHLLKPEAQFWGQKLDLPTLHHGGDNIQLGKTTIEIWHTPGHTPGSACFYINGHLITGDTLFVFGCGRCDMAGGDPEQMFHTLRRLGAEIPSSTIIHPGHDYAVVESTSLAEQLQGNPFMLCETSADFVNYRMHIHGQTRSTPYAAVSQHDLHQCLKI